MAEVSYFWEGTTDGDASEAPYTNDEISDVMRQAFQFDRVYTLPTLFYPIPGAVNSPFSVTINETQNTVTVETGAAIIDGKVYIIQNPKTFSVSSDGYYTIVLRKAFPAIEDGKAIGQTVRAEMLWSASSPVAPTQTDGEVWEVTIAYLYNDGTNITFYSTASKPYWNASYDSYPTESGTGLRIFPETCLSVAGRQGGSSTNWGTGGDDDYAAVQCRIEVGSVEIDANPKAHTFAEEFAYTPVVHITPHDSDGSTWSGNNLCISALSTTGFSVRFDDRTGLSYVHYMAIGPVL